MLLPFSSCEWFEIYLATEKIAKIFKRWDSNNIFLFCLLPLCRSTHCVSNFKCIFWCLTFCRDRQKTDIPKRNNNNNKKATTTSSEEKNREEKSNFFLYTTHIVQSIGKHIYTIRTYVHTHAERERERRTHATHPIAHRHTRIPAYKLTPSESESAKNCEQLCGCVRANENCQIEIFWLDVYWTAKKLNSQLSPLHTIHVIHDTVFEEEERKKSQESFLFSPCVHTEKWKTWNNNGLETIEFGLCENREYFFFVFFCLVTVSPDWLGGSHTQTQTCSHTAYTYTHRPHTQRSISIII